VILELKGREGGEPREFGDAGVAAQADRAALDRLGEAPQLAQTFRCPIACPGRLFVPAAQCRALLVGADRLRQAAEVLERIAQIIEPTRIVGMGARVFFQDLDVPFELSA
jgi:hypothetical protein